MMVTQDSMDLALKKYKEFSVMTEEKRFQHSNNTVDMRTASEDNNYITIVSSERWLALMSAIQVATACLCKAECLSCLGLPPIFSIMGP